MLGPYVLLERLGEGGMGAVFKARHRNLGRVVALKVIRKDRLAQPEAVKRFQREIRAAAQLSHPNIVLAFDADEVARHPLPGHGVRRGHRPGQAGQAAGPAAGGRRLRLHPAGGAGVAARPRARHGPPRHQAAQPAAGASDPDVVKVLDLGLARLRARDGAGESSSDADPGGAVMGTPDYIAPEQALDAHDVDIRADLYSLGCTLYYLLTGKVPFPGGTLSEKLARHQTAGAGAGGAAAAATCRRAWPPWSAS